MPETKDGQFNINLKWFEFDLPGDPTNPLDPGIVVWINFERVIWVKCDEPGVSTTIEIGYEENPETLDFQIFGEELALDAYNKMKFILNAIDVGNLSPQNS